MLRDGLYEISYRGEDDGVVSDGQALAVFRDGEIFGSDRWGGVFLGVYGACPDGTANQVTLKMQVPPHGVLVNGFKAGPDGASLEISGMYVTDVPARIMADVAGKPIDVSIVYVGPVPRSS